MKRKVLFVLIGLFGLVILCSCKQKPASRLLAIGKVDIVTCTWDDFYVSLKLISRELYENITVVATDASVEYRSSVSDAKKVILDETKEEVYSYSVKLQFLEPAVMKKITLQLDEVIADFGVGIVETVFLNQSLTPASKNESEHLEVFRLQDYLSVDAFVKPSQITLKVKNQTLNVIKIKDIALATRPKNVKVRLVKVLKQDPTLVSKDAKDYAYIYFENTCEDIMTTSIILQIDYEYLGETFVKYLPVEFGYTDLLHESSILGATVTEKALISGVVRAENPH